MYQFAISSKTRFQWLSLSAAIHTLIYVSALAYGFKDGLIIPGFWVRIPEGPPDFSTGQAICLACFLNSGSIFLQVACLPTSECPRSAARDAAATPRGSGARAPGKFFQNCPCIAVGVPV